MADRECKAPSSRRRRLVSRIAVALVSFAGVVAAQPEAQENGGTGNLGAPADDPTSVAGLRRIAGLAYQRRAAGASEHAARREPIQESIDALKKALELEPKNRETRAELLRSLFFLAEYVERDEQKRRAAFDEGRRIFDEGFAAVAGELNQRSLYDLPPPESARLLGAQPGSGALTFWGAVHWGKWAEHFGRMAAVRKGVAKKIRVLGEIALRLDPTYEDAGPHRLVGRLHHLTPDVPLLTSWVDRAYAIEHLREAYRLAPADPLNAIYLADALHEIKKDRITARALLEEATGRSPRQQRLVEDRAALAKGRELLRGLSEKR